MVSALTFALPWLVIPALGLWRLSRSTYLRDEPDTPPADAPLISVICPARNEAKHIAEFVRAALATSYSNCELIVVDDPPPMTRGRWHAPLERALRDCG